MGGEGGDGGSTLERLADASDREAASRGGDARAAVAGAGIAGGDAVDPERFIELHDVRLAFGRRTVFDGLSVRMRKGGIHLLLGGSGSGKSTLLRMIGGLQRPDSGEVHVAGNRLSEKSERELGEIRKQIGMLFQNGALLDSMSVVENVGLPLREHTRQAWDEISRHVTRVLRSVGLEGVEGLLPRELSGGMLRRVAFARAIVMEPEILLCDEPFSGLDPINVTRIEDLLVELNRTLGLTIVVTSHHMASSLRMASQLILLRKGACIAGTPEDLASSTDPEICEFLGEDGRAYLARLHELRDAGAHAAAPDGGKKS
ncbi:MAG: ATP-binding cassette domain-containing protein [Myxococcota bacterium]